MAVFKVKALKDYSPIVKGMEVEIVQKINNRPSQVDIKEAFAVKYNINAPGAIYHDSSRFQITEL